ncbi:Uncharacterised protein [Budvicia aquatica]|uniref:Uncharacterized protein n=1 Tax=Budvicia aquatica TaxID=82979 RepID=A0A484ZRM0_9GAMM|nr:Uncharacterised protein [Budvicia aquatica]VFS51447.1 Uncharacterised protein [Budvicia aquatica]
MSVRGITGFTALGCVLGLAKNLMFSVLVGMKTQVKGKGGSSHRILRLLEHR